MPEAEAVELKRGDSRLTEEITPADALSGTGTVWQRMYRPQEWFSFGPDFGPQTGELRISRMRAGSALPAGGLFDNDVDPLPLNKFVVHSFRPHLGGVRGFSRHLRRARPPHWRSNRLQL